MDAALPMHVEVSCRSSIEYEEQILRHYLTAKVDQRVAKLRNAPRNPTRVVEESTPTPEAWNLGRLHGVPLSPVTTQRRGSAALSPRKPFATPVAHALLLAAHETQLIFFKALNIAA